MGTFAFEFEYEMENEYDIANVFRVLLVTTHQGKICNLVSSASLFLVNNMKEHY